MIGAVAVGWALVAGLSWGLSDALAALAGRRGSVARLLVISQLSGAAVTLAAALAYGALADGLNPSEVLPSGAELAHAAVAGVVCVLGLGLLYLALSRGRVGGVLSLATSGAVIPVAVGVGLRGERLDAMAAVGLVCALVGAPLAAWEPEHERRTRRLAGAYAAGLAAGVVNGGWSVAAGTAPARQPWGFVASMHAVSAALACAIVGGWLAVRCLRRRRVCPLAVPSGRVPSSERAVGMTPVPWHKGFVVMRWPFPGLAALAVSVGVTDAAAELSYVSAAVLGPLSVVAALAAVSPAVGVAIAAVAFRERPHPVQWAGMSCAVVGGMLLAR